MFHCTEADASKGKLIEIHLFKIHLIGKLLIEIFLNNIKFDKIKFVEQIISNGVLQNVYQNQPYLTLSMVFQISFEKDYLVQMSK